MDFELITRADPESDTLLLQMVDDHDLEFIDSEVSFIQSLTGGQSFCLKAVRVHEWNDDLSPWPAPAVFGNDNFGGCAARTLRFLQEEVLPGGTFRQAFIGGYSLAGLFALWAGYQTEYFAGFAAA